MLSPYGKHIEMELRHLRYFLAVAEELNFTRAARRLHISQPPLTQQIQALEVEIGLQLFDRSKYRIQLTDAGRAFACEVKRILGELGSAVRSAQRAARGTTGQVRVGFTESASFSQVLTSTFRNFQSKFPDVNLLLEEKHSLDLETDLREGRIDAAFLRPPLRNMSGIELYVLEKEEMLAALPREHRLATASRLALKDLADEQFVLFPRTIRPGLADTIISACEQAGFTPQVRQFAPQLSSTVNLVAASIGISIVPASMRGLQPHAVAYIRLSGRPIMATMGIAHRTNESSSPVVRFVELAKSLKSASSANNRRKKGNESPR